MLALTERVGQGSWTCTRWRESTSDAINCGRAPPPCVFQALESLQRAQELADGTGNKVKPPPRTHESHSYDLVRLRRGISPPLAPSVSEAVHAEGALPERGRLPEPGAAGGAARAGGEVPPVRGGAGALLRHVRGVHRGQGPKAAGFTLFPHLPSQVGPAAAAA